MGDEKGSGPSVLDFLNTGMQTGSAVLNQLNQFETWRREDSAVQRRVADLKKAGLSPVLAAGSAASSSAPIRINAPEFGMGVANQSASIAATNAQRRLNELQYDISDAASYEARMRRDTLQRDATEGGRLAYDLAKSQIQKAITENNEYLRNIGIFRDYKVPSVGTAGDDIIANTRMLQNVFPEMNSAKAGGMSVIFRTLLSLLGRR